jgi:crotonobetainyl-CoA:carnitine CoA-transferase CaiB-like acyl-CoA transferase
MSATPLLLGLRVIEAGSHIAGPVATTILAHLEAKPPTGPIPPLVERTRRVREPVRRRGQEGV